MADLRILDFTTALAGPFCSFLLRELGAEVIHIGRPQGTAPVSRTDQLYLLEVNFNKINVAIDLKSSDGRDLALQLAERADVVLDNFRPGAMDRLGLGFDDLRQRNPRVVVASLSAAGQRSEEVRVGYAQIFAALAGLSDLTGYDDGPPVELRFPTDPVAGTVAALSVLVGLASRKQTGDGCFIDVSARDAVLWTIGHEVLAAQSPLARPSRGGARTVHRSPEGVFPTKDGQWLALAIDTDQQWASLCDALGLEDQARDAGASKIDRIEHHAAIEAAVGRWTKSVECSTAVRTLQHAGVAAFKVFGTDDPWVDLHLRERGFWHSVAEMPNEVLGRPWRLAGEAAPAPERGRHGEDARRYVFGELLGLDDNRIAELRSGGVIG